MTITEQIITIAMCVPRNDADALSAVCCIPLQPPYSTVYSVFGKGIARCSFCHAGDLLSAECIAAAGQPRPAGAARHRRNGRAALVETANAVVYCRRYNLLYAADTICVFNLNANKARVPFHACEMVPLLLSAAAAFAHGRPYFCISFSYHSGGPALIQSLDFIDCQQSNRLCDFFIGEFPHCKQHTRYFNRITLSRFILHIFHNLAHSRNSFLIFFKITNSVRQNLIMHFIRTRAGKIMHQLSQRRIIFHLSIHIQNMRPVSERFAGFLNSSSIR